MNKQPVRVIIGRAVQLSAPGMLGRKFDFQAGHTFLTNEWFFPGERYEKAPLAGDLRGQWYFCINAGTDLPLTLAAEYVEQVIIPIDTETINAFDGAPFKVSIQA